jgi:hypothetical protein
MAANKREGKRRLVMPMEAVTCTVKGKVEFTVPAALINEGFSAEIYEAIFALGLKTALNHGMTKLSADDKVGIKEQAEKNLQTMADGKMPGGKAVGKGKAKGLPKAVTTLAMKAARDEIKILLTRAGRKPANCKASEITRLAKELLEHPTEGPPILAKAQAMIAEFEAKADTTASAINLDSVQEDAYKTKQNKERAERAKANKASKSVSGQVPGRRGRPTAENRPHA